jgi:hypothetical protein
MNVPRAMVGERKIDHGDRMAGFSGMSVLGFCFLAELPEKKE